MSSNKRNNYFFLFNPCSCYSLCMPNYPGENPEHCWVRVLRINIFTLFLILGGKLSVLHHQFSISYRFFYRCSLSSWQSSILFIFFCRFLFWRSVKMFCICWHRWFFLNMIVRRITRIDFQILNQPCITGINFIGHSPEFFLNIAATTYFLHLY